MRLVFFGSGAFGLPSLLHLIRRHDVALVVTQPDRPAGRKRTPQPTPIGAFAADEGLPIFKPDDANAPEAVARIREAGADAFVVIAFGQKLGAELLGNTFAINLHASLLPKYRGAAPINWAVMNGETQTGVSVITLAQRMDAGDVLASASVAIDPLETAGELHDRLAELGPAAIQEVLEKYEAGTLEPRPQDDAKASRAPRMAKGLGTVDFDQPAARVRAWVHGLTPWPGCTVALDGETLKILRVRDHDDGSSADAPGTRGSPGEVLEDGTVACRSGRVELLSVQPPGGKTMTFRAYRNGHNVGPGARFTSV